jgi:long-chain acyl-CoA synthetase
VPSSDQLTLANLPFRLVEQFARPAHIGRCDETGMRAVSTTEFVDEIRAFSLGLQSLGLGPADRVGLVSESRPEWVVTDLAILTAGAVTVPVYPTLSAPQLWYILAESGARFAVVSTAAQVTKLREVTRGLEQLECVIVMDGLAEGERFAVRTYAEVVAAGRQVMADDPGAVSRHEQAARSVAPESLATIVYTSGTTGDPKGVMLTHRNIISNLLATQDVFVIDASDTILSFLPLSHVFERMVLYRCLYDGLTVYFAEALTTVARDLQRVRPTVMTGVPRVYEKIHTALQEGVARLPQPRRALAEWGIRVAFERIRAWLAREPIRASLRLRHRLADRLVLSKLRERTGGRIRFLVSGSAPLSARVAEYFYAIGLPVIEGYGLTESSPVITANPKEAPKLGSVGRPLAGVEVRIGADGEILARGPNIMQGYYKRPDATAAAIEDGWLHTGDIGRLDADGYLTITDRKKDLIVTSGGKKIAPQPLENELKADDLVAEAVLIGERRKFPSALIVPDFARLERWAAEQGVTCASREDLVRHPVVTRRYQEALDTVNRTLAQFERIKRFVVLPTEFTMERGELTPTMKVRRQVVEERWKAVIDELYASRPD